MEIVYEKRAAKALRKMQPKQSAFIMIALNVIADDPFASHPNVEKMKGTKDGFRYRFGDWRAVYKIDREKQLMMVELVKSRGEVYKP